MDLIRGYPLKVIRMKKNSGLIAARNRAYQEAGNELIASIDADCKASPNWLEELLNGLPDGCVGTCGKTIDANQDKPADRWRAQHMPLHWGDKGRVNPKNIYGANQMFHKTALLEAGFLDPARVLYDYKIGATDYQLTQKLYQAGYNLFYNPRAVVYHLRTDTPASVIRTYWRWSVFYYPEPTSLPIYFLKMGINLLKTVKHIGDDIVRGEPELIPISLRIFPFHTYYDFKHLRKMRRRIS
jgi:cellulose synthase/poly-beta-1,6-N-acetylglucosamine synthase-like glycosyltransferase